MISQRFQSAKSGFCRPHLSLIALHALQWFFANRRCKSPCGDKNFAFIFTFVIVTMANNCADGIVHNARQELTSEAKKFAAAYLNETDEIRENVIAEIRCWIQESDDLPTQIDDFLILRFLRVCKFNLEKTKVRMQNYYKHRSVLPEWYSNKNPFQPELQELLELGIILPLRKPDNQGRLIFIVRGTLQDPRRHKISDLAKLSILMLEAAVKYYPAATVHGYTLFIDIGNLTIRHILQFSTYILRNAAHTFQNCYPIRYQKVVFLNASSLFEILMRFIRPFMTEKLKSRFYVYSHEHCFEDISVNILPIEYGGTNGTLQELAEYWKEFIEENRDCLTKDETYPDSNTYSNNS